MSYNKVDGVDMNSEVIKQIFWLCLGIMKNILSLAEFKMGKKTDEYRYFKKEVMNFVYDGLSKFYKDLMKQGMVSKCNCGARIRKGYSSCGYCGGSGYKTSNSE
ncbi:MAG: hypothetical protein ACTSYR_03395 [Candidatus Odinarchaeia archaeon]